MKTMRYIQALFLIALLFCVKGAFAQVCLVTNTNDSGEGSLRAAIECANSRVGIDTVLFQFTEPNPTVNGDGQYVINLIESIKIEDEVIIDASLLGRVANGLPKLRIQNSIGDIGTFVQNTEYTFQAFKNSSYSNIEFYCDTLVNNGGGIWVNQANQDIILNDCYFQSHYTSIHCRGKSLTANNCQFLNSKDRGIFMLVGSISMTNNCLFERCGTAINVNGSGTISIEETTFLNNTFGLTDLRSTVGSTDNSYVKSCVFEGNEQALVVKKLAVTNSVFEENTSGIRSSNGVVDLKNSQFINNTGISVELVNTVGSSLIDNVFSYTSENPAISISRISLTSRFNLLSRNTFNASAAAGKAISLENGANDGVLAPTITVVSTKPDSVTLEISSSTGNKIEFFGSNGLPNNANEYIPNSDRILSASTQTITIPKPSGSYLYIVATSTNVNGSTSELSTAIDISEEPVHVCLVTNTNDSGEGSLRAAVECANSNIGIDTIHFDFSASESIINSKGQYEIEVLSTINVTDTLVVDGFPLSLVDDLNGISIKYSASGSSYLLDIDKTAIIKNIDFNGTSPNRCFDLRGRGNSAIVNCNVQGFGLTAQLNGSDVSITNSRFTGTLATGVLAYSSNVNCVNSTFEGYYNGLGIYQNSTLNIQKCEFLNNSFGIDMTQSSIVVEDSTVFKENISGLKIQNGSTKVNACVFENNTSTGITGGAQNVNIRHSVFVANGQYAMNISSAAIIENNKIHFLENTRGVNLSFSQGIKLSENIFESNPVGTGRAIVLNNNANNNKQKPVFSSYEHGDSLTISGSAENGDTVEVFLNNGTLENALTHIGSVKTIDGTWSIKVPRGLFYSIASDNYYVATATGISGNTSDLSLPYKIESRGCIVTNTNDSGEGSLRAAVECANNNPGVDIIGFDFSNTSNTNLEINTEGQYVIKVFSQISFTDGVIIDATNLTNNVSLESLPKLQIYDSTSASILFRWTAVSESSLKGIHFYHQPVDNLKNAVASDFNKNISIEIDECRFDNFRFGINGDRANSYKITNTDFASGDFINSLSTYSCGVCGYDTDMYVENCLFDNTGTGIRPRQRSNLEVRKSNFFNNDYGIEFRESDSLIVTDSCVFSNNGIGVHLRGVYSPSLIQNNSFNYNGTQKGIVLSLFGNNNTFSQNVFVGLDETNKAITIGTNNGNKKKPEISSTEQLANGNVLIKGKTQTIGDKIELFSHDGTSDNANNFLTDFIATDTVWSIEMVNNNNEFFAATATDLAGNTSEVTTYKEKISKCNLTVRNLFDSGEGSLREVIKCANSRPGMDSISFDFSLLTPDSNGKYTIGLESSLPAILESVIIDGNNYLNLGEPLVEIDGNNFNILELYNAPHSEVKNILLNNGDQNLLLQSCDSSMVSNLWTYVTNDPFETGKGINGQIDIINSERVFFVGSRVYTDGYNILTAGRLSVENSPNFQFGKEGEENKNLVGGSFQFTQGCEGSKLVNTYFGLKENGVELLYDSLYYLKSKDGSGGAVPEISLNGQVSGVSIGGGDSEKNVVAPYFNFSITGNSDSNFVFGNYIGLDKDGDAFSEEDYKKAFGGGHLRIETGASDNVIGSVTMPNKFGLGKMSSAISLGFGGKQNTFSNNLISYYYGDYESIKPINICGFGCSNDNIPTATNLRQLSDTLKGDFLNHIYPLATVEVFASNQLGKNTTKLLTHQNVIGNNKWAVYLDYEGFVVVTMTDSVGNTSQLSEPFYFRKKKENGVCLVTKTANSGDSTLRQAITDANAGLCDKIHFAIPEAGPYVIEPQTVLPTIVAPQWITIDGSTQRESGVGSGEQTITINNTNKVYYAVNGSKYNFIDITINGFQTGFFGVYDVRFHKLKVENCPIGMDIFPNEVRNSTIIVDSCEFSGCGRAIDDVLSNVEYTNSLEVYSSNFYNTQYGITIDYGLQNFIVKNSGFGIDKLDSVYKKMLVAVDVGIADSIFFINNEVVYSSSKGVSLYGNKLFFNSNFIGLDKTLTIEGSIGNGNGVYLHNSKDSSYMIVSDNHFANTGKNALVINRPDKTKIMSNIYSNYIGFDSLENANVIGYDGINFIGGISNLDIKRNIIFNCKNNGVVFSQNTGTNILIDSNKVNKAGSKGINFPASGFINSFSHNEITNCGNNAVEFAGKDTIAQFSNNIITNNGLDGVVLGSPNGGARGGASLVYNFSDNIISENKGVGTIVGWYSVLNEFFDNKILRNELGGVQFASSSDCKKFVNNDINSNLRFGVKSYNTHFGNIVNNEIINNEIGFETSSSNLTTIRIDTISSNKFIDNDSIGVSLSYVSVNYFYDNSLSKNGTGILSSTSVINSFVENKVFLNFKNGVDWNYTRIDDNGGDFNNNYIFSNIGAGIFVFNAPNTFEIKNNHIGYDTLLLPAANEGTAINGRGVNATGNQVFYNSEGINVSTIPFNTFSKNTFITNSDTGQAIVLNANANLNKTSPTILDYHYAFTDTLFISGKSSVPKDIVEVFLNNGKPQNATLYMASAVTLADSTWEAIIVGENGFSSEDTVRVVATATDTLGNTSELSGIYVVPEKSLETNCIVTTLNDFESGSLREAIDCANRSAANGTVTISFEVDTAVAIQFPITSLLPKIDRYGRSVTITGPNADNRPVSLMADTTQLGLIGNNLTVAELQFSNFKTGLSLENKSVVKDVLFENNQVGVSITGNANQIINNQFYNQTKSAIQVASGQDNSLLSNYITNKNELASESGYQAIQLVGSANNNQLAPINISYEETGETLLSGEAVAGDKVQVFLSVQQAEEAYELVGETTVESDNSWSLEIPSDFLKEGVNDYFVTTATSPSGNTSELSEVVRVGNDPIRCYVTNELNEGKGSLRDAVACVTEAELVGLPGAIIFHPDSAEQYNITLSSTIVGQNKYGVVMSKDSTNAVVLQGVSNSGLAFTGNNIQLADLMFENFDTALVVSGNNNNIDNITITNGKIGVLASGVNGSITNSVFGDVEIGLSFVNATATVKDNFFGLNRDSSANAIRGYGISLWQSPNVIIQNNNFGTIQVNSSLTLPENGSAIYAVNGSSGLQVRENDFTLNSDTLTSAIAGNAVFISGDNPAASASTNFTSNKATLIENDIISTQSAFTLHQVSNASIEGNRVQSIETDAVVIDRGNHNKIINTEIYRTPATFKGINLVNIGNDTISKPTLDFIDFFDAKGGLFVNGLAPANSFIEFFKASPLSQTAIQLLDTTQANEKGEWSVTISKDKLNLNGTNYFTATARDAAGNTSELATDLSITINACMVTKTADAGDSTLRDAVVRANNSECNLVLFDISPLDTTQNHITIETALPALTKSKVIVDASSEVGFKLERGGGVVTVIAEDSSLNGFRISGTHGVPVHGLNVENVVSGVVIENTTKTTWDYSQFLNNGTAVNVVSGTDALLQFNRVVGNETGQDAKNGFIISGQDHEINENDFTDLTETALQLTGSGHKADTNTAYNIGQNTSFEVGKAAYVLNNCSNVLFSNNSVDTASVGFYFSESDSLTLVDLNAIASSNFGFYFNKCDRVNITRSQVDSCGGTGLYSIGGHNNLFAVGVSKATNTAVLLEDEVSPTVQKSFLTECGQGISLVNSTSATIDENYLIDLTGDVILLDVKSASATITNNQLGLEGIGNTGVALTLLSDSNTVENNKVFDNQGGGIVTTGQHNRMVKNLIGKNDTAEYKPSTKGIDLSNGVGNVGITEPEILGKFTSGTDSNATITVTGRGVEGDTIHLYINDGWYESALKYINTTVVDAEGKWVVVLNKSDLLVGVTSYGIATATNSDNNTSEFSNIFPLGDCYVVSNKDNGDNEYPPTGSYRQAVGCLNVQQESTNLLFEIAGEATIKLESPIDSIYNRFGFNYYGRNGGVIPATLTKVDSLYTSNIPALRVNLDSGRAYVSYVEIKDFEEAVDLVGDGIELDGLTLTGDTISRGIGVSFVGDSIQLKNLTVSSFSLGVDAQNSTNLHVYKGNFSVLKTSIDASNSTGLRVDSARFGNSQNGSLYGDGIQNATITGNEFGALGGVNFASLWLENSQAVTVAGNKFSKAQPDNQNRFADEYTAHDIYISNSVDSLVITNNQFLGGKGRAISFSPSEASSQYQHIEITKNTAKDYEGDVFFITAQQVLIDSNVIGAVRREARDTSLYIPEDNWFIDTVLYVVTGSNHAITVFNTNNVTITNNQLDGGAESVVDIRGSENVLVSRTTVTGFNEAVLPIDIHKGTSEKSNNDKLTPKILRYEFILDSCAKYLYLIGTSEPFDEIELFFSDSSNYLNEYADSTIADAAGFWAYRVPPELYPKPKEEGLFYIATGSDTIHGTSQASNMLYIPPFVDSLIVKNTADTGAFSLREAVKAVNCSKFYSVVTFDFASDFSLQTIELKTPLDTINSFLGFEMNGWGKDQYQILIDGSLLVDTTGFGFYIDTASTEALISHLAFKDFDTAMVIGNSKMKLSNLDISSENEGALGLHVLSNTTETTIEKSFIHDISKGIG